MIVTKIEEFKKDRFKIFIDGEFAFVLYKGELKSYKIKEGVCLEVEYYNDIVNNLLPKRAKLRAMNILKSHMYTEAELREKLSDGLYSIDHINSAIDYVKSFKYIDDEEYARSYISSRIGKKSKVELAYYLSNKGIDKSIFEKVYEEFYDDDRNPDFDAINKLLEKRLKNKDISELSYDEQNKHIKYLMSKGFKYSDIIKCINKPLI